MIEEYSVEEALELMKSANKSRRTSKRNRNDPNATEDRAMEYLYATRFDAGTVAKMGVPDAFYEGYVFQLGGRTYKPDWVLRWPGGWYREVFEVKGTQGKWQGFRDREARAKLEHLASLVQPFGWRVFLLNVSRNGVTEKEIGA